MKYKSVLKMTGKILGHALTLILILLFSLNLYIIVASSILKIEHPTVLGFSNAIVISGSMADSIKVNDMIIIRREKNYVKEDIITFKHSGFLVTHRIIEVVSDGFRTKGDANNTMDTEIVEENMVLGKVVLIIPKIGHVLEFLKSPLGMTCLVFALVIVTQIPYLKSKVKNKKSESEE